MVVVRCHVFSIFVLLVVVMEEDKLKQDNQQPHLEDQGEVEVMVLLLVQEMEIHHLLVHLKVILVVLVLQAILLLDLGEVVEELEAQDSLQQ